MFEWELWIGPLIVLALALRLRPTYLAWLGAAAMIGFWVSFSTSVSHYGECDPCPRGEHILVWVNTILITAAPAFVLLAVAKLVFRASFRSTSKGTKASDA